MMELPAGIEPKSLLIVFKNVKYASPFLTTTEKNSMGNAVKIGDIGTEHGDCPATPVITGASSVKVDGAYLQGKRV